MERSILEIETVEEDNGVLWGLYSIPQELYKKCHN